MEAREMTSFMNECRKEFRGILEDNFNGRVVDLKDALRDMLLECGSAFEEQTLTENLKEEFQDYMESLKAA